MKARRPTAPGAHTGRVGVRRRTASVAAWLAVAVAATSTAATPDAERSPPEPRPAAGRALAERFAPERMRALVGPTRVDPNWLPGTDRFWYRTGVGAATRYVLVDPRARTRRPLFDLDRVMQVVRTRAGVPDLHAGDLADVAVDRDGRITFRVRSQRYGCRGPVCDPELLGERADGPPALAYATTSPDGRYTVYVEDHDLYVRGPDGTTRRLSRDGERWRSFAIDPQTTYDSRTGSPVRWLGATTRFYVQRWDRRAEGELPLLDSLAEPRPVVKRVKTALPGELDVPVHELWIGDAATARFERMPIDKWHGQFVGNMDLLGGPGDESSSGLFPAADGRRLWFVRIARGYRMRELCELDVARGTTRVLLAESDPQRIDIRGAELGLVDDGRELVWLTMRDGWKHLDLLDSDGRRLRALTSGEYNVTSILRVDSRRREVHFTAVGRHAGENPYHFHAFRVSLDGGPPRPLTSGDATHPVRPTDVAPSGAFFVDNASRPDLPTRSVVRDRTGRVVLELERADVQNLVALGWRAPEPFTVPAADGHTPLYGVMWKPFDFDPAKRYPVVSLVYPGPGSYANTAVEFDPADPDWAEAQALAQLGIVVVRAGHRGDSSHRHRSYSLYGYGRPVDYPLEDARHTIEVLARRHAFLDPTRVGITGYSGGGFMAVAAMLAHPDFFKVGVAGAGNQDNNLYEQNSGEYHFGMQWGGDPHDPARTATWASRYPTTIESASRLAGRLLLLHGELDDDVHPAHTLRLVHALVGAGKHVDLIVVPGADHSGLYEHPYYYRRQWAYFSEHLLGEEKWPVDLYAAPSAPRDPASRGATPRSADPEEQR